MLNKLLLAINVLLLLLGCATGPLTPEQRRDLMHGTKLCQQHGGLWYIKKQIAVCKDYNSFELVES